MNTSQRYKKTTDDQPNQPLVDIDSTANPLKRNHVELTDRAKQVASHFAQNAISPTLLSAGVRMAEFLTIILVALGAYFYHVFNIDGWQPHYFWTAGLAAVLTVFTVQVLDGYQIDALRSRLQQFAKVAIAWALTFSAIMVVAFFFRIADDFSRLWIVIWFTLGFLALTAIRLIALRFVRKWSRDGRLERRAVLIGGGQPAADLIMSLENQSDNDIRVCGIFDDRTDDRSPLMVAGYPKLGTVDELVEFGRTAHIDMLIMALPISAEKRVLELLKKVWVLPVDIRLSAQNNKLKFRPRSYSYEGPVPFLDIFDKPIADWDSLLKRSFDIFFSLVALIVFAPVIAMVALAVKMESSGPVIFRQKRFGFNNEVFDVLKFRSMYTDMADATAKSAVTRNDPRVSRVGRFIRKTSLDELPQLINVLKGELSLVGPRPHAVHAHTQNKLWDEVIEGYFGRHKVKPGVTGWAQINGWRGEVDTEDKIRQRVEHDLYYIENWSVMLDLYILFITPFKLLNTENAY